MKPLQDYVFGSLKLFCILLILIFSSSDLNSKCVGKILNPVTDVCWSCIFPITLGGIPLVKGGREDTNNPKRLVCTCMKGIIPQVGVPISFWEPYRVVEVTRTPWCMMTLGGIQCNVLHSQHQGTVKHNANRRLRSGYYNVHFIMYPFTSFMGKLMDWACLQDSGAMDCDYWYSELEASWSDTETQMLMHPEAILFANPIAQAACAVDCATASLGFPLDFMFWCSGCQGSMYPYSGSIGSDVGGVQASLLATSRIIAKMHRFMRENITSGETALCYPYPSPMIKKSQYKTQMVYPVANSSGQMACNPIGRTSAPWGSGKSFPNEGEDFAYIIWRKRNCCFL